MSKKTLLCVSIVLGLLFSYSAVSVPSASAQASPTYHLWVSKGDSATYNVDRLDPPDFGLTLQQGDRIRVQLGDKYVISLIDKTNSDAFSYEVAISTTYVNNMQTDIGWWFEYLIRLIPQYWSISLGPFFYPAGESFWNALASYFPSLQISRGGDQLTVVSEDFIHYRAESGNTTYEFYYGIYAKIEVDTRTGIASRLEGTLDTMGMNETSMAVTLVDSSISSMGAGQPVQYWYIILPLSLGLMALLAYGLHAKTGVRGVRKEEILSNLSGDELLRLARTIPGAQVSSSTSRGILIKTVKNSLSVEEIRRKIGEGSQ